MIEAAIWPNSSVGMSSVSPGCAGARDQDCGSPRDLWASKALMVFAGAAFGSLLLWGWCHFQEDLVALPSAFLERVGSGLGKC